MAVRSRRSAHKRKPRSEGRLPRNAAPISLTISHIGGRGDGVGSVRYTHNYTEAEYSVFVPASLPGETIIAQPLSISKQGIKARIVELIDAAPTRQTPQCNAFPACGGCSLQHWAATEIETWKHQLISAHLDRARVTAGNIRPMLTSPPNSRRRASFHVRRLADAAVVGFHERMGSHIVDPDGCTIIDRRLASLKNALGALATTHLPIGASLEAQVNLLTSDNTAAHSGLCVYLQNTSTQPLWSPDLLTRLCDWAASQQLARLSIDDHATPLTIFAPTQPQVKFGTIGVTPPPGAFLQATEHGEAALQTAIAEILHGHMHIADLFAGCGSLSLPLIEQLAGLLAVEADGAALTALKAGVDAAGLGGRLTTQQRDLFDLPLLPDEFGKITAVILDPPRSGAIAQCQQIAQSHISTIAMASCNPASFARDAACLTTAGFCLDWVQPVDQFNHSNHLELVGAFSR